MRSIRITMVAVLVPASSLFLLVVGWGAGRLLFAIFGWPGYAVVIVAALAAQLGFIFFLRRFLKKRMDPLESAVRYWQAIRAKMASYADSPHQLIAAFRDDGSILFVNEAGRNMLGIAGHRPHSLQRLMSEEQYETLLHGMRLARLNGFWTGRLEVRNGDGNHAILVMTLVEQLCIHDGSNYFAAIAADLAEMLDAAKSGLSAVANAETIHDMGILLARVGHELRTPLQAIIGLTDLFERSELSELHREYMDQIDASSRHLLRTLNDLLDFSKLEAGKVAIESLPFNVDDFVHRINRTTRVLLGEKPVDLLVTVDPAIPDTIVGDAGRIEQVLLNLLGNSIKFTERGEIEFSIELEENKETEIELSFKVRDTGIGMTEQQMAKIFEPFEQSDKSISRKYGGTGLGLVIAKSVVELMGGRLEAKSEPGAGTEFCFRLRLATERISPVPLPELPCRVLIVEDHAAARERFLADLARFCSADGVASLEDAIAAVRNSAYDLLILDMEMNQMRGFAAWTAIRRLCRERGIFIVSYTTLYGRQALLKLEEGFRPDAVLVKPADRHLLYRTIRQLVLPESTPETAAEIPLLPPSSPGSRQGVLLVDDHDISQLIASKMLEKLNCPVVAAASGMEALRLLQNCRFDLILMDLHMPEMDGLTTVRRIRADERLNGTPIVILTADTSMEQHEECLAAGVQEVLTKPLDLNRMQAVLNRWFGWSGPERSGAVPAGPPVSLPALDGLHVAAALARLDGRQEVYLHLLRKFRERYANIADLLAADIETGNYLKAAQKLHTLRGSSSHLAADDVYDAATRLEAALRRTDGPETFEADIRELEERLQAVFRSISKFEKSIS